MTLAIAGILIVFTVPSLSAYLEKNRAQVRIVQLQHTLNTARLQALSLQVVMMVCPSQDTLHCEGDWGGTLITFMDSNQNHQRDGDEPLIKITVPLSLGQLTWQGFGPRNYIQFFPAGWYNQQNGTFLLCSPSSYLPYARGLIIAQSGRLRLAKNIDNQQIVDGSGQVRSCIG